MSPLNALLTVWLAILVILVDGRTMRPAEGTPVDSSTSSSLSPSLSPSLSSSLTPGSLAVPNGTEVKACPCSRNDSRLPAESGQQWPPMFRADPLYSHSVMIHGMACACNLGMRSMSVRDDYRYSPGIGSHKLHTRATSWNEARKLCNEEGGHLAIVNSIAEAQILLDVFNRSGPVKGATYPNEAFLGIHDLYEEGEWVTVQGDSLAKTGYTAWSDKWGGQPDNGGGRQHCGALLKEGGLDDVACDVPFAFFCELPILQIIK